MGAVLFGSRSGRNLRRDKMGYCVERTLSQACVMVHVQLLRQRRRPHDELVGQSCPIGGGSQAHGFALLLGIRVMALSGTELLQCRLK